MPTGLETAIVRICKSNGVVVGAGFLVSQKHVITCAHVIADALGISRDTQKRPTEVVYLDFPLIASEERLTGRVVFWRPVPPKGSISVKGKEDIAALELNSTVPEAAQPVDLVIEEDLRGHPFRTFGFPAGHDDGLEATGVLRGRQGTGWIQIEDVKETGVRLEPGFSGAPIWDEQLNGVVGMAVAADQKRPEAKVAFMIPTKVIATAWSELTIPPLIVTKQKRFRYWQNRFWITVSLLFIPTVVVMVFLAKKSPKLLKINKPQLVRNADKCENLPHNSALVRIAIANFDDDFSNLKTEARIFNVLNEQKLPDVEVCRTEQRFINNIIAKTQGEALEAAVIIWGQRDPSVFEVSVTNVGLKVGYLTKLTMYPGDVSNLSFQAKDLPQLVSVMAGYSVSEIYKSKGQIIKARQSLAASVSAAELRRLDVKNELVKRVLSQAHFFLGLSYQATTDLNCNGTLDDCNNALQHLKTSSELDENRYEAILMQGTLYEQLKQPDRAMEAYNQLIHSDPKSPAAVRALRRRASLYLIKGEPESAVKDLKSICQLQPYKPRYLHFLGLAQLQAKQIPDAKQTYQQLKPYLEKDKILKDEVIEQLKTLAEQRNELSQIVNNILVTL